jgi:hypothetical protein
MLRFPWITSVLGHAMFSSLGRYLSLRGNVSHSLGGHPPYGHVERKQAVQD